MNLALGFGFGAMFFAFISYHFNKEQRFQGRTQIHFLKPPGDLMPAEMGFLVRKGFTAKEIMAAIVDLQVKKYIEIDENMRISCVKGPDEELNSHQVFLLEKLGEVGDLHLEERAFSEFFYGLFYTFRRKILEDLESHQPFKVSPLKISSNPFLVGEVIGEKLYYVILIIILVFLFTASGIAPYLEMVLMSFLFGVMLAIAALRFVPMIKPFYFVTRNEKGMKLVYEIDGFKHYLETVEKDRFKKAGLGDHYKYAGYGVVLDVKNEKLEHLYKIIDRVDDHSFVFPRIIRSCNWLVVLGILVTFSLPQLLKFFLGLLQ